MASKINEFVKPPAFEADALTILETAAKHGRKRRLYRDLAAAATASCDALDAIESLTRDISALAECHVARLTAERKQIPWWYYFERRELRQEIQSWRKLIRSPRATN